MELIGKKSFMSIFRITRRTERRKNSLLKKASVLESNIEKEMDFIIPKSSSKNDLMKYFSILGIKPTSDKVKIRKAYINKAKVYHPDISSEINSERMMKELNEAYASLTGKDIKIGAVADEKRSVFEIERLSLDLYVKLRNSDYEKMLGMARQGITRPELIAIVNDFCDWNKRFVKVETAITGRLDKRLKALEKHKEKCKKFVDTLDSSDAMEISEINKCITAINNSLREGYTFRSYADIAFSNARERIVPIEREQKEKLRRNLG